MTKNLSQVGSVDQEVSGNIVPPDPLSAGIPPPNAYPLVLSGETEEERGGHS